MTPDFPCFSIARFVLEAESAFAIASGLSDGAFDALVVRDANNLPAVPGTSLTGILRNLYQQQHDEDAAKSLFGFIDQYESQTGKPSRLHVSWGCVHDSHDRPVEGIRENVLEDPLLERLAQDHPLHRERVKINENGVAEDQKKFDMTVIPAGCRFSFEISLWSKEVNTPEWEQVLALLGSPNLRIGGLVRSGLGQFRLERLHQATFDLRNPDDYRAFSGLPVEIGEVGILRSCSAKTATPEGLRVTLSLQPDDFWRFGQGTESLQQNRPSGERMPNTLPFTEPRIDWQAGEGKITPRHIVIPGSGVKGALRHRIEFHYRRQLLGKTNVCTDEDGNTPTGADTLLGYAADTDGGASLGEAGAVFFSDLYVDQLAKEARVAQMAHTSIDRFTGGVRDHVLYLEELLWKQPLKLTLTFDPLRLSGVDDMTRKALRLTLEDLVSGRLALGAASSKGHGYFSGDIHWSDDGKKWIGEDNA